MHKPRYERFHPLPFHQKISISLLLLVNLMMLLTRAVRHIPRSFCYLLTFNKFLLLVLYFCNTIYMSENYIFKVAIYISTVFQNKARKNKLLQWRDDLSFSWAIAFHSLRNLSQERLLTLSQSTCLKNAIAIPKDCVWY